MNIYSNELAEKYSNKRVTMKNADAELFGLVKRIGIAGKDVLDLGSGDGTQSAKLLNLGARSLIGLDMSPAMVRLAQEQNAAIKFVLGDATAMPFEDASFDIVFSSFMLQHCRDTAQLMREVARVLKNDGYFVAVFNTVETNNVDIFNSEMPILLGTDNDITVYDLIKSDEEVQGAIHDSGLRLVRYEEDDNARASIDPSFKHFADIKKLKAIVCLCQKLQ
ncbi:MAG: class I SAM-dependent methyltransferase [Patescibacteria group bacterium]